MADADDYGDDYDFDDMVDEEDIVDEIVIENDGSQQMKPELRKIYQQHPECIIDYIESVTQKLPLKSVPPTLGENIDENHKTYPFLTLYERTRIIGLRSNQLSQGARPFINVPEHVVDVREIARLELEQKRLPYIIKRPLPNGQYEYWRLADLMIL
jgi:DNA-directed RNA polymerase subunit K/omega